MAKQLQFDGTEREYPAGIKRKLTRLQNTRETKAEAHVAFKKAEADLLDEMQKEKIEVVVDDSAVPPYLIAHETREVIKKRPYRAPKAAHVDDDEPKKSEKH